MATTITYEVPTIEATSPDLNNWGDHTANALLDLVVKGDGQGITEFLAGFYEHANAQHRQQELRQNIAAAMLDTITKTLLPQTRLTGFKSHANPDPRKRYSVPTVPNEGEGCQVPSCGLAAKFRLPDAPESMTWGNWTLTCQKHTIQALDAQAHELVDPKGKGRIYLSSSVERMIKETTRDALKTVKA